MTASIDVTLRNDPAEIGRLQAEVEAFCESQAVASKVQMQISLVLEELLLNCIDYGYPESSEDRIVVTVSIDPETLTCRINDGGVPYDPFTEAPPPDITSPLADRRVGGLGVHLVKQIMDSVSYQRIDGRNTVTVVKRLS